jgi:hypothetical protein
MYQQSTETLRAIMNKTIFTRLYVDGDKITNHELKEPFDALTQTYTHWHRHTTNTKHSHNHHHSRDSRPPTATHSTRPPHHSSATHADQHDATKQPPRPTHSPALTLCAQGSKEASPRTAEVVAGLVGDVAVG